MSNYEPKEDYTRVKESFEQQKVLYGLADFVSEHIHLGHDSVLALGYRCMRNWQINNKRFIQDVETEGAEKKIETILEIKEYMKDELNPILNSENESLNKLLDSAFDFYIKKFAYRDFELK